jgi:guanylate kinase
MALEKAMQHEQSQQKLASAGAPSRRGVLFVISGPSGVGKTSLCRQVVVEMAEVIQSVSYTTRAPRLHEQNGREYHFVSHREFEERRVAGEFLEWAQVHGRLYGTSRQQVAALTSSGIDVLLAIDVQGAVQIRTSDVEAVFIFLLPPDWATLVARLQQRGSEAADMQEQRLAVARQELAHYTEYDYVVVNDQLTETAEVLKAIIIAERQRVVRVGTAAVENLLARCPAD